MKKWSHIAFMLAVVGASLGVAAQVPNEGLANRIVAARRSNADILRQYTWNCRTELMNTNEDKVLDIRIDQVQYGPDGNLQRTELNNQSFSHPRGFLRRIVAASQQQQLEQYLKGLRSLLDEYTLPTAGKVIDFMAGAKVQFTQDPDGMALLLMQGSNVVVPGDSLSMWADASTHKLRKIQISTSYEGGSATVTASFKTLPSGLNFMSLAEVALPDKNISLTVHNYDYVPNT